MKTRKYVKATIEENNNMVKGTDMISANRAFAKRATDDQLMVIAGFIAEYPEYADLTIGLFED